MPAVRLTHFLGRHDEPVDSGLCFNLVEFHQIKTGIVQLFPNAKKFNGVFVLQPILYKLLGPLKPGRHVRQADVVLISPGGEMDWNTLYQQVAVAVCHDDASGWSWKCSKCACRICLAMAVWSDVPIARLKDGNCG